ncbi:MAG: hypothetical protein EOP85_00220 [Verrucomicrobiaceae bacterium]|nr:MAG: hypothetical protein EOP85_00220 [Verrucomicrobiaceae bacterium]
MGWFRQHWNEFKEGRPGHRFQDRYERNKEAREERSWLGGLVKPAAGIMLVVAGVVFCLIPGPGLPLLLVGAGLLADVSLPVAKAMDWCDIRIRELAEKIRAWWKKCSPMAKCTLVMVMIFLISGAGYGGYRLLMERIY